MKLSTFIKRVKSEFIKESKDTKIDQCFLCAASHKVKLDLQAKTNNEELWLQYGKLYLLTVKEIECRIYPYTTMSSYLHHKGRINLLAESSYKKVYQYKLEFLDSLIRWAKDKDSQVQVQVQVQSQA